MSEETREPHHLPESDDLRGSLRTAVEAIRSEPVPHEALSRILERARRLAPQPAASWKGFNQRLGIVSGIAAALLIWAFVGEDAKTGKQPGGEQKLARLEHERADQPSKPTAASSRPERALREKMAEPAELGQTPTATENKAVDDLDLQADRGRQRAFENAAKDKKIMLEGATRSRGAGTGSGGGAGKPSAPPDGDEYRRNGRDSLYLERQPTHLPGAAPQDDRSLGALELRKAAGEQSRPSFRNLLPPGQPGPVATGAVMPPGAGGGPAGPGYAADNKASARRDLRFAGAAQKRAEAKADEAEEAKGEGKAKDGNADKLKKSVKKEAAAWHRDAGRPTFARVYVGDGNALELISLQVTVTVEGPRARTLVDHVFHNPHDRRLEGTFEYPLPTGASPSYFAMFLGQTRDTVPQRFARGNAPALPQEALAQLAPADVAKQVSSADWGTLREARVVSKQKALETYEEVVRGSIDPALLEYAGGNTFRGRVFPIPPRGYNRVLIAYEELLPSTGDQVLYRYPLPDCKLNEMQFTLNANPADYKQAAFHCTSDLLAGKGGGVAKAPAGAPIKPAATLQLTEKTTTGLATPFHFDGLARKQEGGGRATYTQGWKDNGPGGEAVFAYTPAQPQVQAIGGRHNESGPVYLYARVRPDLPAAKPGEASATPAFADRVVFLLDTSLSESPDRFDVSMKLLRKILETDPNIKQFNVLAFNVGTSWVEPKAWLENNPAGREKVWTRLDGTVLEGATDLSAALDQLAHPAVPVAPGTPVDVFLLSDGQITWGEPDVSTLVSRFENSCPFRTRFHCYRTGIGAENLELFDALTRRGGGVFNCFTEAELPAAAAAHRHQCLQVERVRLVGGPPSEDVLVAGRKAAVYPGGDLIVAARVKQPGATQLLVEGTYLGKKVVQEYPIAITASGELAPRGWAEIAVASLLAVNDPKLDNLVTAYCQQFGIGSRLASFLILENDNDYKRFNLEEERGKTLNGDLGLFLEEMWKNLGRVAPPREVFERFLAQVDPRVKLLSGPQGEYIKKLLLLLTDADFDLPGSNPIAALVAKTDVPPDYLAALRANPADAENFLKESRRRTDAGDADGAVRALSSIIEEYAGRTDALRLVGYRLLDLKQSGRAVRLFQQVQQQRPFEPHSYRDLARSLEESGKFGQAAVQYESILAGTWHNRFHDSLKQVALEEYAQMMRQVIRDKTVGKKLADHFGERLEHLDVSKLQGDLRVTISWNTDATDVDLWVIEPDGTKCFYSNPRTPNGGELSQDQTQGYGPERYFVKNAKPGLYRIIVHYFRPNPNLLAGETHVNVVVTEHAGTPQERSKRSTVILKRQNEEAEVGRVKF